MEQDCGYFGENVIRRDFLKVAAASTVLPWESRQDFGYIKGLPSNLPTFQQQFPKVPDGKGEVVLLHPYLERVLCVQSLPSHLQTGKDCTSQAISMSNDITAAIQVSLRNQRWEGKIATEWVHFGGRCVIGKERNIDGGVPISYACEFINKYGVVFRKKYNKINFTNYNIENSNLKNILDYPNLIIKAKKHTMGTLTKVENWEDARAALKNLAPVVLGSRTGFNRAKRDKLGFTQPSAKGWNHAWMLLGFDDRSDRKGALLMNSHGDYWVKGPRRHNQPRGSVWVDIDVLESMIIEAFALSNYVGTKPRNTRLY